LVDPATPYCERVNACSGPESHFTVVTADGQPLATSSSYTYDGGLVTFPTASVADCSQPCQPPREILAQCPWSATSFSGAAVTWHGEYVEQLWCDNDACQRTRYVPAGSYIVVMCATVGAVVPASDPTLEATCPPSGEAQVCVEVPFVFPSATPVVGQLPGA